MNYYDDPKNAEQYIKMADGYDGQKLIDRLLTYLPAGTTVLELGMGPGTDLELLAQHYVVTGSDRAQPFLDRYRALNNSADLLLLDAVTLETERTFDAIYSNKVLYHLTRDELRQSFARQVDLLNPGGIALHSFWVGEDEEDQHGLHFAYYTEETLRAQIGAAFEVLEIGRYTEMSADDSLWIILRKLA